MRLEDMEVIRVDQGVLVALAEEELRMAHEVLVERVVQADEEANRVLLAPPAPPRLLPGAGDAARVAGEYGGIQVADVHAQLQGGGRHRARSFPSNSSRSI